MAIYTPRGLKIRISIPYAFGLMARLYPKVTPFRVLKTTEGIETLPAMLGFIAGMVSFIIQLSPFVIGMAVLTAQLIGFLINLFGFYIVPALVSLPTIFSYISGWGIFLITAVVVGFFFTGWQGVLAFFLGQIVASMAWLCIGFWQAKHYYKLMGQAFTSSEIHFFNAYRLHASRIGATTDIDLKDEELEESHWMATFESLAIKWPEVVRRFTME